MIYAIVFIGSFLVILAAAGGKVFMRNRFVRRYVRCIRQRIRSAEERAACIGEAALEKPQCNGVTSSIQLQKVRMLINAAERAEARGKLDEAESCYIQALTAKPDAHEARAKLAKLYLKLGRDQKAEAMYMELLAQIEDVSCYSNLGLAYYRQGKFEKACAAYEKALEREPSKPERLASLGRALYAAERFAEAVGYLDKAAARLTRDTELLRLLAKNCENVGDMKKTVEVYKKINKLEPYDEEVKSKLNELVCVL